MRHICTNIESIHVSEKPIEWDWSKSTNPYAQLVTTHLPESHPPVEGLNEVQIAELVGWVSDRTADAPPTILFDWDRTIAQTEGFVNARNWEDSLREFKRMGYEATIEDVLVYTLGGEGRVEMLREMASQIEDKADIYIISNNSACSTMLYSLAKLIFRKLKPENILCVNRGYYRTKAEFLLANPELAKICRNAP